MGTTNLDRLLVRIEGDTTKLRRDMRSANDNVASFGRKSRRSIKGFDLSLKGAAKSVLSLKRTIIGLAGAGGLAFLISRSISTADTLAKTADKVGLTTDSLQELRFGAELAGVNIQTMDMAMQRFSRRVGEVAIGTGELKGTFERLGISVKDSSGNLKTQDQLLDEIADAIKGAKNEQERLSIAFKAFDSEGAALVNLLKDGSKGLDAFRARARELGLVLEEDLIRGAEGAKDRLTELKKVLAAAVDNAVLANAEKIAQLAEKIAAAVPRFVKLTSTVFQFLRLIDSDKTEDLIKLTEALADLIEMRDAEGAGGDKKVRVGRQVTLILGEPPGKRELGFFIHRIEEVSEALRLEIKLEQEAKRARKEAAESASKAGTDIAAALQKRTEMLKRWHSEFQAIMSERQLIGREDLAYWTEYTASLNKKWAALRGPVEEAKNSLQQFAEEARDTAAQLEDATLDGVQALEDGLVDLITRAKSAKDVFRDMTRSIIADLARIFIRQQITGRLAGVLGGLFQGGGGSGGGGSVSIPLAAHGANLAAGQVAIVGEEGPELFRAPRSGTVIPNGAGGGTTVIVNQTIHLTAGVAEQVHVEVIKLLPVFRREAIDAVLEARGFGGSMAQAMGARG